MNVLGNIPIAFSTVSDDNLISLLIVIRTGILFPYIMTMVYFYIAMISLITQRIGRY